MISLSKQGCIEYAKEMRDRLESVAPMLICSMASARYFGNYTEAIETYAGKKDFAIKTLHFYAKCSKLLDAFIEENPNLTIYFPVFHPWNLLITRAAKKRNIPVVTTVHDYNTHLGEKSKLIESIQNRTIKLADLVIFLTENEKKKAIHSNPWIDSKAKILEHPLLRFVQTNTQEHTEKLNILFLGRLKKYKGFQLLSDVADKLNVAKITIAGKGEKSTELSPKVDLINKYLSEKEIADLIQSHHILIVPYAEASQSGVVTLGIQSEMVMIISDLPGLKEQLDVNSAVWIEPKAESLLMAIQSIQEDPKMFLETKKNVRNYKRILEEDWKIKLQKILSL